MNIDQEIIDIKNELKNDIEIMTKNYESGDIKNISVQLQDLKVKYLGKNGKVTRLLKNLKTVKPENKKEFGLKINDLKVLTSEKIDSFNLKINELELDKKLNKEKIDLTMPVDPKIGSIHPIEKVIEEQIQIFENMGYEVLEGPEIETTNYIFDMLRTPIDHPARELQDTFYTSEASVLRSQTSAIQIRKMLEGNPYIKMICPGKVFRSDSVDATHSPVFHQMEGLVVGEGVTMSDLKGTLELYVKKSLGEKTKVRFRPHHFPYTEPSAEVDVTCFMCGGKGCSTCKKEGFIELLGCGMVHPEVLENCGIDSSKYSGFAFGFGMERIAMAKFKLEDMRMLYENDVRFLKQFN